jgi:predicted DsbA family dithiol-disulfide isomerase
MKVEIWSDFVCPFCYIGKRNFESALQQFSGKDKVEVTWHSFQLNPDLKTDTSKSVTEYLSETKGWTIEEAEKINEFVTEMAAKVGLEYHLDALKVSDSFNAHRLLQLSKRYGQERAIMEIIFKAYFTDCINIDDPEWLFKIGIDLGIPSNELVDLFNTENYREEVNNDRIAAKLLGINAVPCFVFDKKYGISGAQEISVFLDSLENIQRELDNPIMK